MTQAQRSFISRQLYTVDINNYVILIDPERYHSDPYRHIISRVLYSIDPDNYLKSRQLHHTPSQVSHIQTVVLQIQTIAPEIQTATPPTG